jgi:hypothetical protein
MELKLPVARIFETTLRQCSLTTVRFSLCKPDYMRAQTLRARPPNAAMEQLAAQTGGAAYIPKTTSALDSAFKEIAADLAQQYILSYYHAQEIPRWTLPSNRISESNPARDVRVRVSKGILFATGHETFATRNQ